MRRAPALLLLLVAGCKVDQAKEVALYRAVLDLPPATRPADAPANAPLSLRDALLLANAQSEQLAVQGETFLRAVIERRRSAANFLPTLTLAPTYSLRENVPNGGDDDGVVVTPGTGTVSGGGGSRNRTFDVPLDLEANLFNGFRDVNAYWRDSYQIEAQRNDLLALQETLLLDVARAYFAVLRGEAAARVIEASLATQAERLREARGRVAAGIASGLVEAQIAAQESATKSQLLAARRDVTQARALLAEIAAVPVEDAALTSEDGTLPPIGELEALLSAARAERNEVRSADAAILAARREVEVAFGQYYPSVALRVTAFLYRETDPTERDWEALFGVNLPLFAAGRIRADVREAWSFHRQAVLVRRQVEREVVSEVRQARAAAEASDLRLAEAQVQVAAAEQALRQADANYRAGLATNLDRVTAQDDLLNAQLLFENERFDRQLFRLELLRATGRLREWLAPDPTTRPTT